MSDINNKVNGLNMNPIIRRRLNASSLNAINDAISKSVIQGADKVRSVDYAAAQKDYKKNNVLLNQFDTEAELQKQRADNQSVLEQAGNSLAQMVGGEILLGIPLGISNLIDSAINVFHKQGKNDYTNPISTFLEEQKEKLQEETEIHLKDPNKSFAMGDFGWWAKNAVSVASTVSLLIPSMGVTKGISYLGKIGKIGTKTSMGLAKVARKLGSTKSATRIASSIGLGAEIGANAFLSRTMEGYMEARGVYNEVYEDVLQTINSMSDEDRNKLIERNPNLEGKTNEEMASYIAGDSADETFRKDYAMLLMDVMQFKAIGSLWKGAGNKMVTSGLRQANRTAISELAGETAETATKQSFGKRFIQNRIDNIQDMLKHPLSTVGNFELGEAFEEGYQGIATEKGKEVGKMYLDPSYTPRTIESYLKDSQIWEQAFWGALGGIAFQKVGTGLGNLARRIEAKTNKDNLSETDFANLHTAEEKIRGIEIKMRSSLGKEFAESMNILNNFQSLTEFEDNTKTVRKKITKEEAEIKKEEVLNDYIAKLVMNAVDAGNYELLMEYVNSSEFNEYFDKLGINNDAQGRSIQQAVLAKSEQVYNDYSTNLYNIYSNTEVENESVIRSAAHQLTRQNLYADDLQQVITSLNNKITELNTSPVEEIDAFKYNYIRAYVSAIAKQIDAAENEAFEDYNSGKISKQAYDEYIRSYNKRRRSLFNTLNGAGFYNVDAEGNNIPTSIVLNNEQPVSEQLNLVINSMGNYPFISDQSLPTEVENTIKQLVQTEDALNHLNELKPKYKQDFIDITNEFAIALDKLTKERIENAAKKVEQYITSQEDLQKAMDDVIRGNVPELKEELDILKLGHESTKDFMADILATVREENNKRNQRAKDEEVVRVDGNEVSEQQEQEVRESINRAEQEVINPAETSPSTGEETKTNVIDPNELAVRAVAVSEDTSELDAIVLRDKNIYEQEQDNPNRGVTGTIQSIMMNLYKTDKGLFEAVADKDQNSSEFKNLIDAVLKELIDNRGVHPDIAKANVYKGVYQGLNLIQKIAARHGDKLADKLFTLANSIANRSDYRQGLSAVTVDIPAATLNEIIDEFLDTYVKYKNINQIEGQKTVINLEHLLKDIIKDKNLNVDIDTAMYIVNNISEYVNNINNNKYIFIKPKNFDKYVHNPQMFYNDLLEERAELTTIDNYMHVSGKNLSNVKEGEMLDIEYVKQSNGKVYSISIKHNGKEVGYLSLVEPNKDNIEFTGRIGTTTGGIQYTIRKNGDEYIANTDWFFNEIFNQDGELWKMINEYRNARLEEEYPNKAFFEKFMNHPAVKKAIEEGLIILPTESVENPSKDGPKYIRVSKVPTTSDKGNFILNKLMGVIFYDTSAETFDEYKYSYEKWLENAYKNYQNTYKIQQALDVDNKLKIKFVGRSNVVDGVQQNNLNLTEEERGINTIELDATKNPLVVFKNVDSNTHIINEQDKTDIISGAPFNYGNMGMVIGGKPETPLVALFTSANNLTEKLNKQLQNELTRLLEGFQDGNISYDELYDSLKDLFNGPGINHPTIFSGYSLVRSGNKLAITVNDDSQKTKSDPKYVIIINKYKEKSEERRLDITYRPKGNAEHSVNYSTKNKQGIAKIAREIANNVKYNRTFFTIDYLHETDVKDNKYMYKENGKFVINIGGTVDVYDSFGDFVLKNNAFNTRQAYTKKNGYYLEADTNSMYIDISSIRKPEAEEQHAVSAGEYIMNTKDTQNNERDTVELLEKLRLPENIINILNGKNQYRIKLIPDKFGYNENIPGHAGYSKGKVYISKSGANLIQKRPTEVVRLMIHENLHKRIEALKTMQKKNIVEDIFDIYEETIQAIENVLANEDSNSELYKLAEKAKKYLTINNYSYETYFDKFAGSDKEYFDNLSEQEKKQWFAEEWLAESLSVSHLINFTNEVKYSKGEVLVEDIKNADKTIWQKIIDVLLKLFGINNGNIKNNTILAREYQILGNEITPDIEINSSSEQETQQEEETEEDINEDEDDDYREFKKLATTKDIQNTENYIDSINNDGEATAETFGVTRVTNMDNYLKLYEEQDRAEIKRMIEDGTLNYLCRR